MSARLLVSRLPLVVSSSVSIIKMWLYWLFSTICLSLCPPAWEINLKVSNRKHASALSSWERGEMYRCTRCRGFWHCVTQVAVVEKAGKIYLVYQTSIYFMIVCLANFLLKKNCPCICIVWLYLYLLWMKILADNLPNYNSDQHTGLKLNFEAITKSLSNKGILN